KMPAFEWVHVQLHQQKGMISLSPPTICNSASMTGCWNGKVAGYLLNILIFMLFVLIFNIIFVMRTKIVAPIF
ncbi:hypothetical protein, partial [Enterobacter cloacae]|uniref:hypothetical protein n=1 Tax=Enterobacter cloacae TaxID=550 RepID=UPI00350F63DF